MIQIHVNQVQKTLLTPMQRVKDDKNSDHYPDYLFLTISYVFPCTVIAYTHSGLHHTFSTLTISMISGNQ